MIKYLSFLFIVFLVGYVGSCDKEKCEETKAPEINFKFLLGGKIYIVEAGNEKEVTNDFSDLNMLINKAYCNGEVNGPFEQNYLITTDGQLVRQSIGTWSFRMDNTKDYMNVNLFCEGEDLGTYNIFYDDLKKHDGGTAYYEFEINTTWDPKFTYFINTVLILR